MARSVEISNADITEIVISVPAHHRHLRTRIRLQNGDEIVLQEAAVANLVRGFVTVKTHPQKRAVRLRRVQLDRRKKGFAEWQLLEESEG